MNAFMSISSNYSWDEAEKTCLENGMSLPSIKTTQALRGLVSFSENHDCGLLTFLGMKRNSQVVTFPIMSPKYISILPGVIAKLGGPVVPVTSTGNWDVSMR